MDLIDIQHVLTLMMCKAAKIGTKKTLTFCSLDLYPTLGILGGLSSASADHLFAGCRNC
jgi:hypothetical protein